MTRTRRSLRGYGFHLNAFQAIAIFVAMLASGCVSVDLSMAQHKLSSGQYVEAHRELTELSSRKDLSAAQQREIADDLCLSEFKIGRPSYPLPEQRRACANAVAFSGSQSAPVLAQIDATLRDQSAAEVESALRAGDISRAEMAALRYANSPGADRSLIAQWSPRIWELADRQINDRVSGGKRNLSSAVSQMRSRYPKVVGMSAIRFEQWARRSVAATGSSSMVVRNELAGSTLHLWIPEVDLPDAALHLNTFVAINDALTARCACSARTRISDARSGLPAYLLYFDTDLRASDVFVLPGAQNDLVLTAQK